MTTQKITQDEWLRRYKQRFLTVAGVTDAMAEAEATADSFEVLSEGFEDDPEAAADESMTYWSE